MRKFYDEFYVIRLFFLVAFLSALLFSCESWILGPFSWVYGYGSGLETIPTLKALSFYGRNFSFWSPFIAGGVDRLAFWGNANPIGIEMALFSTLPAWAANGTHRFLQYFIAIFFTSRIVYEQFKLNPSWSCLSGILFGCFSYYTVGAMFTLPGVPLMLWLLKRIIGKKPWILKTLGTAFLLSFMTTFTFGVPYLLIFAFLWLLFIQKPDWSYAWYQFFIFSGFLVLFTMPQLMAIATYASASHRAHWPLEPITFTLHGLFYRQLQFDLFAQDKKLMFLTMNLPWVIIFLGVILSALSWSKNEEKVARQFLRLTFLFALFSQKWLWLGIQHLLVHFVPFVAGIYMGRFFEIPAPFLIALLITLTLHMVWYRVKSVKLMRCTIVSLSIGLILFMLIEPKIHLFYALGVDDWGAENYKVTALDELRKQQNLPFRVASVLPLQPAYAYAQGLETVDGWANIYPVQYRDLWLKILAPLFQEIPETQDIFGLHTGRSEDNFIFLGADLVRPHVGLLPNEDLSQALISGFDIDRRFNLNLLRLLNTRYLLSEYPLKSSQLHLIHAPARWLTWPQYRSRNTGLVEGEREPAAHVKYKLFQPWVDLYLAIKRKKSGKDIFIYEISNTLERFRFVTTLVEEPTPQEVLQHLASANNSVLKHVAFTTPEVLQRISSHVFNPGQVELEKYEPDYIRLHVVLKKGEGFLVIANTWSPHWKACIDQKPAELHVVNYVQYGLRVGEGSHDVKLYYSPAYKKFLPTYFRKSRCEI